MLQLNKKADSVIISYVLLISITLTIAALAYGWLKFQADISEPESCPDGVSIYISDYSFDNPLTHLNLTLLNRGRFNIKGFFVRINNDTTFETGIYTLGKFDLFLRTNEDITLLFNQLNHGINISEYKKICFIEVQPFVNSSKNEMILCQQKSTKKVSC